MRGLGIEKQQGLLAWVENIDIHTQRLKAVRNMSNDGMGSRFRGRGANYTENL
jgi:hypothetical protein